MRFNRKGQAATEFAVLGSLIIMAFAFLINYSEQLNRKQANLQQTFREALKTARNANNSGSYTKVAFRRMPNVGSPMELGQVQSFSDSANVLWAYWPPGPPAVAVPGTSKYKLNEADEKDVPYQATPVNDTKVSENNFENDVDAITTFVKTERGSTITTTKGLVAQDILKANVNIGGTPTIFPDQYLGDEIVGGVMVGGVRVGGETLGGKYYPGARTLVRPARKME